MKNRDKNRNDESQVPRDLCQALLDFLWPLNTWWKKIGFLIVVVFVICFFAWRSLPDKTKIDAIDYFLRNRKGVQPQAVETYTKSTSENIKNGKSSETVSVMPQAPAIERRARKQPLQGAIQQHTEGDQSPAVVSEGDVNIRIEGKQK